MKRAIFFVAAILTGITMTTGSIQVGAAQVKAFSVNRTALESSAWQDYLSSYPSDSVKVITIPCIPGIGNGNTGVPELEWPDGGLPEQNRPGNPNLNNPDCEKPEFNIPEDNGGEIEKPGKPNQPENNRPEIEQPNKPEAEQPSRPNKPENNQPETEQPSRPNKPENNQPETEQPSRPNKPENNQPETEQPGRPNQPDLEKPNKPDQDNSAQAEHAYVRRIVELVNEERAKEGLPPLALKRDITAAAQVRAVETEVLFSHTRPNGNSFTTALKEAGVSYRGAGENIAWGQKTPEQVMSGWMNSPGHRANILNKNYTSIGVGYYQNASGVNYWTQLFTY